MGFSHHCCAGMDFRGDSKHQSARIRLLRLPANLFTGGKIVVYRLFNSSLTDSA